MLPRSLQENGDLDKTHCDEVHVPIYSYLGHQSRASVVQSVCWLSIQGSFHPE